MAKTRTGILYTSILENDTLYISGTGDDHWREELVDPFPSPITPATAASYKWCQVAAPSVGAREANNAIKFRWDVGDPLRGGNVRAELKRPSNIQLQNDTEYWVGWSVFFEDNENNRNYVKGINLNKSVVQFHHVIENLTSQLHTNDRPDNVQGKWQFAWGSLGKQYCGNIILGQWNDFVLNCKANKTMGFAKLWINAASDAETPVYDKFGDSTGPNPAELFNPKIGIYHGWDGLEEQSAAEGWDHIEFYIDSYRIGNAASGFESVSPGEDNIYYVDQTAGNDGNSGVVGQPWKTLTYATRQLVPGDTLRLMAGTYTSWGDMDGSTSNYTSGTSDKPITIINNPGDTPMLRLNSTLDIVNLDWWIFDGLLFNDSGYLDWGDIGNVNSVKNWVIQNCTWEHNHKANGSAKTKVSGGTNFLFKNNRYDNLRTRLNPDTGATNVNGSDAFGIGVGSCIGMVVDGCTFIDCSGDGIQSGTGSTLEGFHVKNCHFEIIRPYQYRAPRTGAPGPDPNGWIGLGENGIDLKGSEGAIIEDSTFIGFRPANKDDAGDPEQDASGAPYGAALVLQQNTNNAIVRRCYFSDNCMHIQGSGAKEISNNIFVNISDEMTETRPGNTATPTGVNLAGTGKKLENNMFWNPAQVTDYVHVDISNHDGWLIRNNVFDTGEINAPSGTPVGATIDYNAWANPTGGKPNGWNGAHDVNNNSLLIDYTGDFRPQAGSPVIGKGFDAGYATDYSGTAIVAPVDIGAQQFDGTDAIDEIVTEIVGRIRDGETGVVIELDPPLSASGKRVWIEQNDVMVEQEVTAEDATSVTFNVSFQNTLVTGEANVFVGNPVT